MIQVDAALTPTGQLDRAFDSTVVPGLVPKQWTQSPRKYTNRTCSQVQRQGALGGGGAVLDVGTIAPTSRSMSASGSNVGAGSRVISSSGMLGGGGLLGPHREADAGTQSAGGQAQVAEVSEGAGVDIRKTAAVNSEAEQMGVARIRPGTVPKHTRPRRRKSGAASGAAAAS